MRNRLKSGLASRFAAAAALMATLPSVVCAWDEDRVQSQLQPYFGVWAGAYMVRTDDLNQMLNRTQNTNKLTLDNFSPVLPAAGLSLGVAYSRLHVGVNAGYQLLNGDDLKLTGYYTSYKYQVIPVDVSLDVALLRNEAPINLLLGGSLGVGLVGIKNPFHGAYEIQETDTIHYQLENSWSYTNALLATGYIGARINLARRLNLEGQVGWRVLSSDETQIGDGAGIGRRESITIDSSNTIKEIKVGKLSMDLSGAYVRVDVRWTFASQSEKEEDRAAARSREMTERIAMLPSRKHFAD